MTAFREASEKMNHRIEGFDFEPGEVFADKYEVLSLLGSGWEGEVYRVREMSTGVERAAKFFYLTGIPATGRRSFMLESSTSFVTARS